MLAADESAPPLARQRHFSPTPRSSRAPLEAAEAEEGSSFASHKKEGLFLFWEMRKPLLVSLSVGREVGRCRLQMDGWRHLVP